MKPPRISVVEAAIAIVVVMYGVPAEAAPELPQLINLDGTWEIVFDSGSARLFDPFSFNFNYMYFAQNPVAFFYGPGSIAEVSLTPLSNGEFAVSLSLPLDLTVIDPTGSPGSVTFSMSGNLEASGSVIPEPSTALLLAFGLVGLTAGRRRA